MTDTLRRRWPAIVLALVATLLTATPAEGRKKTAAVPEVTVTDLRTERMTSPMSIDTPTPRLGWRIESELQNVVQTQARVIVSSTREKAEKLDGDLWDTLVRGSQSQWVEYGGKQLKSNTRCYWRVRATVAAGTGPARELETGWSDVAMWNVGLLTESDWRGQWIGYDHFMPWDSETEHSRLSSRYLRTEFSLDKPVRQATLYICGLGVYECFINGSRIGRKVLTPAPTDYRKTVLYDAYDVTARLSTPASHTENCIAVVLGNGRYFTMQQNKKPWKINRFGMPTLRMNLIVEFEDGTRQVVDTNEKQWKLNVDGALRSNNEYDGETYDARRELTGWTLPGYDDSRWMPAERTALPQGTLRGTMMPGMKVVRTLKPKSVTSAGDRKWVIDMGQNMAGWMRLRIGGGHREGDSVVIRFAERLDKHGNIWTENYRHAESTDRYYASGRETDDTWWSPVFTYHGFRYAEVSGLSEATTGDFVGEVVSDEMEETGSFACTDTILNKIYHNATWGLISNYKGMPVDCPQRDERQPWLGDRTRGCYGEAFAFDVNRLYTKWMRDIVEAQREDGCIPDVAPAYWNYYSDNVTWPAALPFSLDMLYRQYGDPLPMRRYYADVKRWLEHLKTQYQKDGLITKDRYGDWCVPPEDEKLIHSKDPDRVTDGTLISTAYYYHICEMMAGYAAIGAPGVAQTDKEYFEEEARLTKEAFNRNFLTDRRGTSAVPGHWLYPDSVFYGNNTVTANLLPLVFGMTQDDRVRQEVAKQIVKKLLEQNGGTVSCGVIGIGWLMHALTDMGRTDLAWLLATNKQYPSWGYMTEHGATTIWELWNGDTASPKMNSGNHVMLLGDLIAWLYEDVAGIQAAEPGFKKILLRPDFTVDEMNDIDASYNSIYGRIVSRWKKEHGQLKWHIEIPANTTATAILPSGEKLQLGSGSHDLVQELGSRATSTPLPPHPSNANIIADEFIYTSAPFPSCHSASIVETRKGDLVATWFGGTKERNPDVCIWVSRKAKGAQDWTEPVLVADGVEQQPVETVSEATKGLFDGSKTYSQAKPAFGSQFRPYTQWTGNWGEARVDGVHREATWNPVLFETTDGTLHLYFKIGPNVANWKGWHISSRDGGKTWSRREPLPDGIYGPIKNKPVMTGNRIISPTSDERNGWKVYFELSDDMGKTWRRTDYVEADSGVLAIQPTVIQLPDGRMEALCRTRSRHIGVTFSDDRGETWSRLRLIATPNNNSGIDAVTLSDGTFALICNDWPIEPDKQKGARTPLSILRSSDGISWKHWVTLEDSPISQYSYPSIIQTRDGHLHAIYTWRRQRIKHVELIP